MKYYFNVISAQCSECQSEEIHRSKVKIASVNLNVVGECNEILSLFFRVCTSVPSDSVLPLKIIIGQSLSVTPSPLTLCLPGLWCFLPVNGLTKCQIQPPLRLRQAVTVHPVHRGDLSRVIIVTEAFHRPVAERCIYDVLIQMNSMPMQKLEGLLDQP